MRASSVENLGGGEPLRAMAFRMIGMPVQRPSVRSSPDGRIGTGITEDVDRLRVDADLDRLALIVAAVIHRVDERLFDRRQGVVEEPRGFRPVGMLDDLLDDDVVPDVGERVANLLVDRSSQNLLDDLVAAGALGEDHHVDLRAGKEFLRRVVEEQDADVTWTDELVAALDDIHQAAEFHQRQLGRLGMQAAADILQIRPDQRQPEILDAGLVALPVVERDGGGQAEQLPLFVALGLDGAGVAADVVMQNAVLGRDFLGSHVGAVLAAGRPEHDQVLAVDLLDAELGEVGRLDQIAVAEQFPLDLVERTVRDADGREDGLAVVVALLADDDVPAAEILEVIGEGTQGADRRIGVPARLVLDAVAFDGPLSEQIFDVDRQFAAGRHGRVVGRSYLHILSHPPADREQAGTHLVGD